MTPCTRLLHHVWDLTGMLLTLLVDGIRFLRLCLRPAPGTRSGKPMARNNPPWGQERIANELLLKLGLRVSPRTVGQYMPKRLDHGRGYRVPS